MFKRRGVKIGRGVVTGRIRILRAPVVSEFLKVESGDIIVVKNPVPEYTVILSRVAAVIADEGGATCHLATIVREYKKLGWFGVGNATEVLRDSAKITLSS